MRSTPAKGSTDVHPMTTDNLAPVFLDNKPVVLQDPKPKLSAIITASGKSNVTNVKWLQFQPASQGKPLRPEEVLDRTSNPTMPIYLTSGARTPPAGAAGTTLKVPPIAGSADKPMAASTVEQADDEPVGAAGEDDQ